MRPRVEILTFPGCPNGAPARELVERAIAAAAVDVDLREIDVPDAKTAQRLRFLGSPTIRVNGRDVEPGADAREDFHRGCRLYRSTSGLGGVPDESWVDAALEDARRGR